jgi:FkbM family methyltransferase
MGINYKKDRLMETSSLIRRLYGLKLVLKEGFTEESKWFMLNREKLKYRMNLKEDGLVLDFGGYMGDFSANLLKMNPKLQCKVFEPVNQFANFCQHRFKDNGNVEVIVSGVSSDGRDLKLCVDGPRTKNDSSTDTEYFQSVSINSVLDVLEEVELMKMNIEGMEYECLRALESNENLKKVKYLLVQFHNFNSISDKDYRSVIKTVEKSHTSVFKYKWLWELYKAKPIPKE